MLGSVRAHCSAHCWASTPISHACNTLAVSTRCPRILEASMARALEVWTALAVVVTTLSLLGPLTATSEAAVGALVSLHAVVAAVVIASAQASRRRHAC